MGVLACADLLRVSERTIRGWESGATRIPYAAYKLLRVLKGGRYLAHPGWKDFIVQGDTLVTPEGHRFQAGQLAWWSLLVRQARAFGERLRGQGDRVRAPSVAGGTTRGSNNTPAEASDSAPALGLVSSSTSDTRQHRETGATAENKGNGTGQLVAARKGVSQPQQVNRRLGRVVELAGGAA
jgi:hypothetical protein